MSNCTLYVKKLTVLDAFTNKSIRLPKLEARAWLGELRHTQSTHMVITDELGRDWEMLCTCLNTTYALSRIGMFCHIHNVKPGSYLIFYRDCKRMLRIASRTSLPAQLHTGPAPPPPPQHLQHLQQERWKRSQNMQQAQMRYQQQVQLCQQLSAESACSPASPPPPQVHSKAHSHLREMFGLHAAAKASPPSCTPQPNTDRQPESQHSPPKFGALHRSLPAMDDIKPGSGQVSGRGIKHAYNSGSAADNFRETAPDRATAAGAVIHAGPCCQTGPLMKRARKHHHLACSTTMQDVLPHAAMDEDQTRTEKLSLTSEQGADGPRLITSGHFVREAPDHRATEHSEAAQLLASTHRSKTGHAPNPALPWSSLLGQGSIARPSSPVAKALMTPPQFLNLATLNLAFSSYSAAFSHQRQGQCGLTGHSGPPDSGNSPEVLK